jgi:hypothetical protein
VINAQLGITPRTAASRAQLRADRIRRDTLTQLAAALREADDNDLQNALDALIEAVGNPADGEGAEIDALVGDIEDLAGMGRAVMDLTDADVRQLADEAVHAGAIADGSVTRLPQQQDRRAS